MEREELAAIVRGVEEHADPVKGMTNTLVERFCRLICSAEFVGVFSADCLPAERLLKEVNFVVVVNLGEVKRRRSRGLPLPVGHFVTLVGTDDQTRYFDPYGFPPSQPHVLSFLRRRRRRIVNCVRLQVQDFGSKNCGLYAMLFAAYYDPGRAKPPFRLKFFQRGLRKNDRVCARYLRQIIRTRV